MPGRIAMAGAVGAALRFAICSDVLQRRRRQLIDRPSARRSVLRSGAGSPANPPLGAVARVAVVPAGWLTSITPTLGIQTANQRLRFRRRQMPARNPPPLPTQRGGVSLRRGRAVVVPFSLSRWWPVRCWRIGALYATCPSIVAHAGMVTTDWRQQFTVVAAYLFARWLIGQRDGGWRHGRCWRVAHQIQLRLAA